MYFQSHLGSFADGFEEYYIFAGIMDPFQTSLLAPYVLKILCWIEN